MTAVTTVLYALLLREIYSHFQIYVMSVEHFVIVLSPSLWYDMKLFYVLIDISIMCNYQYKSVQEGKLATKRIIDARNLEIQIQF